ncbi:MAG: hypothetical protein C4523_15520 [Myxococcales bacterium]|nr:MAG: hypothetical protein C4523_15520 [Myxococcales bacterium]
MNCQARIRLTDLQTDIDLMLLDACDSWSCIAASATPLDIQHDEEIKFSAETGRRYVVAVDGYAEASGTYTIAADCACEEENCLEAGGLCNDYFDTCSMGTKRADYLQCDLGVCCVPMTCSEAGGSCFPEACPQGWDVPRYGDSFTCRNGGVCCVETAECPAYMSSLAQCPFRYFDGMIGYPSCPDLMLCMDEPCQTDTDCFLMNSANLGGFCVAGNCVYCWEDSQCPELTVCRGGRCVHRGSNPCPAPPACDEPGCALVEVSETSCTVCVCDTIFDDMCDNDEHCRPMAHHYFQRCVYGRCAECRNGDDCENGQECLPPGLCYSMTEHPSALYGSWLIGWWGALNHYSYFRFEPDGTLRRGTYNSDGEWMDDIFLDSCSFAQELPIPLLGTWEPEVTQSGLFIVKVAFQTWCSGSSASRERFQVKASLGGGSISLVSIDHPGSMGLEGWRVDPRACSPDFAECEIPVFPGK